MLRYNTGELGAIAQWIAEVKGMISLLLLLLFLLLRSHSHLLLTLFSVERPRLP